MVGVKEILEEGEALALQLAQHQAHVLAHRELLARDVVVCHQPGAGQDVAPGLAQVERLNLGQARLQALLDGHLGAQEIAAQQRQRIQARGGELDLFVFEQAAHEFGARVFGQLGMPVITPTDAPQALTGAKATNAALLRGVWAFDDAGGMGLLRFDASGRFVSAITDAATATTRPGVELGWFEVDANGQGSRLLELDTDGQEGFSHRLANATFGVGASVLSANSGGETINRFPDTGSGIVGVWSTSLTDVAAPSFAFFPSGRMVSTLPFAEAEGACATARLGPPGVEAAPYTFNPATGALAVGPRTLDTSGCTGLWDAAVDPAGAIFNSTVTIAADGRSAVFTLPEGGTVTLYRVAVQ